MNVRVWDLAAIRIKAWVCCHVLDVWCFGVRELDEDHTCTDVRFQYQPETRINTAYTTSTTAWLSKQNNAGVHAVRSDIE